MDKYFVLGNPINHSYSPLIHTMFAEQTGEKLVYEKKFVPIDSFFETAENLQKDHCLGCNVTVPFKEQALKISSKLTERARLAEAVNTLKFCDDCILGDNTDGIGLITDLLNCGVTIQAKKILIIGAGGATKGILLPILEQNPTFVTIANRTKSKAENLKKMYVDRNKTIINAIGLDEVSGNFDIIINASSSSLKGEIPNIPTDIINSNCFVYDLMYSSQDTVFLKLAKSLGAQVRDGLGMLVEQAAESFLLWRNVRPDTKYVYNLLRNKISNND